MKKFAAALGCCLLLCSCATSHPYPADDPRSARIWTPAEVVEEMAGSDPVEPFNRAMFTVNDVLMHYLVRPVSWIYGSILPKEVILSRVWGLESNAVDNHVEVYVGFLRKKLKSIGSNLRIEAIRRLGYHLEVDEA